MTNQPQKRTPRKAPPRKTTPPSPPAPAEEAAALPAPEAPPVVVEGIADVPAAVAWAAVMRDVEKITKDDWNPTPGASFKFRGIDATMNTVGPVLRKHGVIVVPHHVELLEAERYDTKGGTAMFGVITKHVWNVIGPRGDGFLMETLGQSADAGDKAIPKAASVAYRTALLQALTVPTGDRDPDADSHERDRTPDPRQEQWDRIAGLAEHGNFTKAQIAAHYLEKMGHVIDGPDATVDTLTGYADKLEASLREQIAKAQAEEDAKTAGDKTPGEPLPTTAQAEGYEGGVPAHDHDVDNDHPDPPASTPAAEPAPADVPAQPEPQTPAQGRDPRQALWDDILRAGAAAKMGADALRAHFRTWAADAAPDAAQPVEIDGPAATPDLLTRYFHVLRATAEEAQP